MISILEAKTNITFFETFSPLLVSLIITGIFGLLTGIYFERVKNKILILTYNLSFQSLGTAINDKFWGDIEIFHDKRPIKHLNLVTLTINNDSRSDAQSALVLEIWVDPRSQFLGHNGHYNTGNIIRYEDNYNKKYDELFELFKEDEQLALDNDDHVTPPSLDSLLNYIQSNRKLSLPTFNRKSHIKINFLIENFDGVIPNVYLSILEKGIKLLPEGDKSKADQVKKIATSLITSVAYILGLWWIFIHFPNQKSAIVSTVIVGSLSYLIGWTLYNLFIYLKKFFW